MSRKARTQKFVLFIRRVLETFAIHLAIFCIPAQGCECPELFTPPCALYARADVVFVGTLSSLNSNSTHESGPFTTARFRVDEALKGVSRGDAEVAFPFPECNVRLTAGEKYLVYARRAPDSYRGHELLSEMCSGSKLLGHATSDLQYVRSAAGRKVHESISGVVTGLRGDELKGIQVKARRADWTGTSEVDAKGFYKIELPKSGTYDIDLVIPLQTRVLTEPGLDIRNEMSKSFVKYTTNLKPGECNYKELRVIRIYSSTIRGKVVDASARPVPNLSVHLYEYSDRPAFPSLGGQIAGTDEAGNYLFRSVKEGKYFLGVNLGGLPNFLAPYAATYFPGVSSVEKATVVTVDQNQQLALDPLRLPSRAVELVVKGQLIWPDGTPVAHTTASRPNLYLIDPQNLNGINSARADGSNTILIGNDGRFSFIAFEGYTYVIHVDTRNPQGQEMHAKHMRFKIERTMAPLTLRLSLPGNGRSKELIRNELGDMQ